MCQDCGTQPNYRQQNQAYHLGGKWVAGGAHTLDMLAQEGRGTVNGQYIDGATGDVVTEIKDL